MNKKLLFVVLAIVLFSIILFASLLIDVSVQQEMMPEWTFEDGSEFFRTAISADGYYFGAGTSNTNRFYIFQGNISLWNYPIGNNIDSIAMSFNGDYVAVGAETYFYLFDSEVSSPLLQYQVGYEKSQVVISADGNYVAVGAGPMEYHKNAESKLYVFEKEKPSPTWTKTLQGVLEGLSMSGDGSYIVVSTSLPGVMYVFSREQETQLWNYTFGDWSGGVKISSDGDYIIAVGGDQDNRRVFQFVQQNESARYQKLIPELPSHRGLSASSNGSIFAISYTGKDELILFNIDAQRLYSPSSIQTVSLPASRVSMSMSSDGRYIFVGTSEGLFVYEYLNDKLRLKKRYTHNSPIIYDVASSSDGRYLVAVGHWGSPGDEQSNIYFFDIFRETAGPLNLWAEWSPVILIIVVVTAGTIVFVVYKRRIRQRYYNTQFFASVFSIKLLTFKDLERYFLADKLNLTLNCLPI